MEKYCGLPRTCGCKEDLKDGTIVMFTYRPGYGPQIVRGVSKYANRSTHLYDIVSLHHDAGDQAILCSAIYIPRPENPCWPFAQYKEGP